MEMNYSFTGNNRQINCPSNIHLSPRMPHSLSLLFMQASPLAPTLQTHVPTRTCPKLCNPQHPQVRRLSLPTTRERCHLKNIRVRRVDGRHLRQTRARCFSLKIWPLAVMAPRSDPSQNMQLTSEYYSENFLTAHIDSDDGFTDAPILADEDNPSHLNSEHSTVSKSDSINKCEPYLSCATSSTVVACQNTGLEPMPVQRKSIDPHHPFDAQLERRNKTDGLPRGRLRVTIKPLHTPGLPPAQQQNLLPEMSRMLTVPPWAYTVITRAPKSIIGKRSVLRNRAKRRIRAAAAQIFPCHASRHIEYVFTANPESLIICFEELVEEVRDALKAIQCWEDNLPIEMIRREKYCER